jgi:leucine-zipper of insertion element IS481/GrpB protein/Integrase core domain
MSHPNAPLTPNGRLRLARCVVHDGWPLRRAAERFQVAPTTAKRWADRYRANGPAGMVDRSSRPHHSPHRLPTRTERRILGLRVRERLGPARIAARLGLNPATVHRVLVRYRAPRLDQLDRATGVPVRRYERAHPGELVHVDIKKLGRIPHGGGHKTLGRAAGRRHRSGVGYTYLHTAIDDHSRLAYTESLADERQETAAGFWHRAHAWFAAGHRVAHLHLLDPGTPRWAEQLRFRDRLRARPVPPAEYAELKRRLAREHAGDREAYAEGKAAFVRRVLAG